MQLFRWFDIFGWIWLACWIPTIILLKLYLITPVFLRCMRVRTSAYFWAVADSCQVPGACRQQVYQKHVCHLCCSWATVSRWRLPQGRPPTHPLCPLTHLSDYVKCVPVCVWELLLCSPIWSLFETTYIAHCDRPRRPHWHPHPSRSFAEHFAIFICIFAVPLSTVWRKSIVVCNKRKTNQALPTSFCSGAKIRFSVYVNTRTEL